jgi:hypothetical protein
MQTFLPYKSFTGSLKCLDNKRLGKQRVEAMQILNTLTGKSNGWKNHPAVRMWRGYEDALCEYHNLAIDLWMEKGFNNSMIMIVGYNPDFKYPHWLTDEFCNSHRSNLLRKDPLFYKQYGWDVTSDLPYIWPV